MDWEHYRALILENSEPEPNTGCWLWTRGNQQAGYPMVTFAPRSQIQAKRLAYLAWKGEFDRSLLMCHTCDVKWCVNPAHLYAGTASQNGRDSAARVIRKYLRAERVREIRRLLASGHGVRAIARQFGVTHCAVSSIKTGRTYAWLQ